MKPNDIVSAKKELITLYFKFKQETRLITCQLKKNFSEPLLNEYYATKKLTNDLKNILGTGIKQIP